MLKFFVCALFVSFACATPGLVGHYPGAVSHVSRVDVHDDHAGYGSPLAYAPLGYGQYPYGGYEGAYGAGYGGYGAGYGGAYGYGGAHGYPLAQSYSNRVDIHAAAAPVVPTYGHGYGGYGLHDGNGFGYAVHGYGVHGLHHGY